MDRRSALDWLPWLTSATLLALGVAWRDCVLTAMSVVFGGYAFYAGMDVDAPWQGWRAALRCWLTGTAGLLAALALMAMVISARLTVWTPANDRNEESLLVLVIAVALCWVPDKCVRELDHRLIALLAAVVLASSALMANAFGMTLAPCIFASLTSIAIAVVAWRLARQIGGELIMADRNGI